MNTVEMETDILSSAAVPLARWLPSRRRKRIRSLRVMLLEKANVKRSGAISRGMDGLNNAVIPGHATQCTKEITMGEDLF
jgi:hypothetical protein